MKNSTVAFISSIAIATTLLWTICSFSVAIFPELSATVTGKMMHIDPEYISFQLGWQDFFIGLLSWIILAVFGGWLFITFYNRLRLNEKV